MVDIIKFAVGNTVMVTKGRSTGRVGVLTKVEKHDGSFDIVEVKDAEGHVFATRLSNVFLLGKGGDSKDAAISLPSGKGIKLDIFQIRDRGAKTA